MKTPRLKAWRESAGETQVSLGEKAGITEFTILRAEHGADLRPSTAKRIAEALGISVADLMEEPPVPLAGAVRKDEAPKTGRSAAEGAREVLDSVVEESGGGLDTIGYEEGEETRGEGSIYEPWLEFVNRYADRWERKITEGAFNHSEIVEFMSTLEDFQPILIRLGRQEQREQGPDYIHTYGPTIGEAVRRITDLFNPMIREGTKLFEENDLARLRRERDELASGRVASSS